jgi:hypothetical protein
MNCPKCNAPGLIVESSSDGKTRHIKCNSCGLNEVKDVQGRSLLTEVPTSPHLQSTPGGRQLLTEG